MSYRIEDLENDPNWKSSLGEKLGKIHFRNGHYHAVCDPRTGMCDVHYDPIDPHESLVSLVKHMDQSNLGKFVIYSILGLIADQVLTNGTIRKSIIKSLTN